MFHGGLKFKANKVTGDLDEYIYCPAHQTMLVEMSNASSSSLLCPKCGYTRFQHLPMTKELSKKFALSISKAKVHKHLKDLSPLLERFFADLYAKQIIKYFQKRIKK